MNNHRYEVCKKCIEEGRWKIDLENGIVIGRFGSKGRPDKEGYLWLGVSFNSKDYTFSIHEIIAVAGGLVPIDTTIDHINGNNQDNRLCNLQVMSLSDNISKGGCQPKRYAKGSKHHNSKLSEDDITEIRELLRQGRTQKYIAELFGIDQSNVSLIKNNKAWR